MEMHLIPDQNSEYTDVQSGRLPSGGQPLVTIVENSNGDLYYDFARLHKIINTTESQKDGTFITTTELIWTSLTDGSHVNVRYWFPMPYAPENVSLKYEFEMMRIWTPTTN